MAIPERELDALAVKLESLRTQFEGDRREDGDLKWRVCPACNGEGTQAQQGADEFDAWFEHHAPKPNTVPAREYAQLAWDASARTRTK